MGHKETSVTMTLEWALRSQCPLQLRLNVLAVRTEYRRYSRDCSGRV